MPNTEKYGNNQQTTLSGNGGSITSGATSLIVAAAFTNNAGSALQPQFRILIDSEIMLVTAVSGTTYTVTRAQENTSAASHNDGATVTQVLTAGAVINNPRAMTTAGDIEYLNSSLAPTRLALGGANTVLHGSGGTAPAFSAVVETDMSLTDITTANVSTTAHGLAPKAPNDITKFLDGTGAYSAPVIPATNNFRLTLTSGTPVTTSDVTGATTIYWTPYNGKHCSTYDSSVWTDHTSAEINIAVGTIVKAQAYDLFVYNNSGTLTLEMLEWSNVALTGGSPTQGISIASPAVVTWDAHGLVTGNSVTFTTSGALPTGLSANTQYWITKVDANTFKLSTSLTNLGAGTFVNTSGSQSGTQTGHSPTNRATSLSQQDGVWVKSSDASRRYVGTFFTTATTTTEDSLANRYLDNASNRVRKKIAKTPTANGSWTIAGQQLWTEMSLAGAATFGIVCGLADRWIDIRTSVFFSTTTAGFVSCGIGQNSNTVGLACDNSYRLNDGTAAGNVAQGGSFNLGTVAPTVGYTSFSGLNMSEVSSCTAYGVESGSSSQGRYGTAITAIWEC